MTAVATSFAICVATRVRYAATRTPRAAKIVCWCHPGKNVAKLNVPFVIKGLRVQVLSNNKQQFFLLLSNLYHVSLILRFSGTNSECPASIPQPDRTECLEKGQCRNGTCLPFCVTQNYQSCMCDTVVNACKRCCYSHFNKTCFSFEPHDILPDGTPCVHGFCNSVSRK